MRAFLLTSIDRAITLSHPDGQMAEWQHGEKPRQRNADMEGWQAVQSARWLDSGRTRRLK